MMEIGVEWIQNVLVCGCDHRRYISVIGCLELYYSVPLAATADCGSLNNPLNGQVTLTDTTVGSTATYECDSGFTLVGNEERTCQDDGTWSGTDPTCDGMS